MNKKEIPHLYLDTSVLAGTIQRYHKASTSLMETIVSKNWRWSTSAFAFMELFDITQDNAYVLKQLQLGVYIKKAYKSLDQKDLTDIELKVIQKTIIGLQFQKYDNFRFYDFEKDTWDAALNIKAESNISAPDTIHLATALDAGCDLLVTLDQSFLKEAKKYIKSCSPDQVEKILKEMGFKI